MKTAFVWPVNVPTSELGFGAHVGTHCLASICEMDNIVWRTGDSVPDISEYDCLIVNLFAGMDHVELIKILRGKDIYVIAVPDASFDEIFIGSSTVDMLFLRQLQAADAIGYVSESNRQFYGALFPDKPTVKIPMPIGHDGYFKAMRSQDKEDFIITCDHPNYAGVDYSIQNVVACAAIQRATGLHVVYVDASPKTQDYAAVAGLRADFKPKMVLSEYARLSARARLGVDAYALHGFGRNTLVWAACGTPAFGSTHTEYAANMCDPWNSNEAAEYVDNYLSYPAYYESSRQMQLKYVEEFHSFDACRKQMLEVLEQVQQWRLPQHN